MKSYFKKQIKYCFSLPPSNGAKAVSFKRIKMHQLILLSCSCTVERDIKKDNWSLTLFYDVIQFFFHVSQGTFKPNFRLQHHFFLCLISRLLPRRWANLCYWAQRFIGSWKFKTKAIFSEKGENLITLVCE